MLPAHFVLCVLSCIAFSGVANAVYEDCQTPPPVDHATVELFKSDAINTANYSCAIGYILKGVNELTCYLETEEWQGEPPTCVKAKVNAHEARKRKLLAIPEELNVAIELAQKLDLSCIQANVQAPEISHGIVSKYERRRRGEKIFLVAYYACQKNYNFESTKVNALYCSNNQWLGELPSCENNNDEEDDDEDNYDEYETIDNDDDAFDDSESDTASAKNADADPVAPPPPPPPVENVESVAAIGVAEQQLAANPQPKAEIEPVFEIAVQPVQPQAPAAPPAHREEVVNLSQPEPVAEAEPEPAVAVQVNEQQPEPELQTEQTPATDINIVVAPTKDPYTPRLLDENCGNNNGHCEHKCQRLLFPGENEPRLMCTCNEGYTLDPQDYASCHDIDECQESNGGCSQICNNLAGSFECACEKGYQIDAVTGNSCVDIDECAQPEVATECANGCENMPGSYRCVIPLNTKEDPDQEPHSAEQSNEIEHQTVVTTSTVEPTAAPQPSCNPGFVLSADTSECQDINECVVVVEDNGNADHVPHRVCQQECVNTIGSYRCGCHEGYHLLEDQSSCAYDRCEDLDNPELNRTRCAHQCANLPNGRYACLCPEGYTLDEEDLHSCNVVETVCSREQGHERCQPGSCLASEDNSTFSCLCPPGYISEIFSCQDLDECVMGTHKCSHDCFNTDGGYQCICPRGMTLQEPEGHTCVAPDPCANNNNGCEQLCLSADAGACTCSKGYTLHEDGKSCTDVDECQVNNGGCQQLCRNLPGSHVCACDRGYELSGNGHSCQDVDECAGLLAGGCTHECINKPGSYECGCPLDYLLQEDERSCLPASMDCPPGTEHTEQGCQPIDCGLGKLLGADNSCVDIDECQVNNGGCSHQCANVEGSYRCSCPAGYTLGVNAHSCEDVNECAVDNGGCQDSCSNEPGSFKCSCAPGKRLSFDARSCLDMPRIEPRVQLAAPVPVGAPVRPVRPGLAVLPELSVPQVKDQCVRFQAPTNGQAHCNKYRHKRKLFYNTRCKVRCNDGYLLLGSEIRSCGASGNWEGQDNKCVPIAQPRLWMSSTSRSVPTPALCPALPAPQNGVISPASCTQTNSNFGAFCQLQCNMGFVPVAGSFTTCMSGWSLGSVLECKPLGADIFGNQLSPRVQAPWQRQPFRQLPIEQQMQTQAFPFQNSAQLIKPYITCPESVVILLNPHESRAHVILHRPATNVDHRHVVAFPAWAAKLQAHLPAGVHKIVYRAHDPKTQQSVGCQTIITIKKQQAAAPNPYAFNPAFRPATSPVFEFASSPVFRPAPVPDFRAAQVFGTASVSKPFESLFDASKRSENLIDETPRQRPAENLFEVTSSPTRNSESSRIDLGTSTSGYCPPSFEVTLKENQNLRSVAWKEPRFEGKLLKIYKSSFPGALFGLGDHTVKYEATTTDGLKLQCTFQIHVKRTTPTESASTHAKITFPDLSSSSAPAALTQQTHSSLFTGHESYVICPGEEPVKVTDRQSVNLPVGCTLKNVRPQTSSQTHPKRVLLTSLWRQYANL